MAKNLEEKFKLYCNSENLEINQNQIIVIKKLEDYFNKNFKKPFFNFLSKQDSKKAFYIFGDVGVGKTMILDFFYNSLNEKKKRNHFNEFMLNFHNFAHDKKDKGNENIIDLFVKNIKSKFSLIYFDEFQVTNIVDAMILGKLFQKIFDENLKIFNKDLPVFVYCLSGGRSSKANEKIQSLGFKNVYELDGGILEWRKKKTPRSFIK